MWAAVTFSCHGQHGARSSLSPGCPTPSTCVCRLCSSFTDLPSSAEPTEKMVMTHSSSDCIPYWKSCSFSRKPKKLDYAVDKKEWDPKSGITHTLRKTRGKPAVDCSINIGSSTIYNNYCLSCEQCHPEQSASEYFPSLWNLAPRESM